VRRLYLAVAVIGAVAPVVLGVLFVREHGLDVGEMGRQLFATTIATLAFVDLAVSSLAFWVWLAVEGSRVGVRRWPFVAANLLVGLCFALPLFLYVRSGRLERSA
jgi:Terpene cyclase DEP1